MSYNKIKRKSLRLTTRMIVVKMNNKVKVLMIHQNKVQNNNLLNNKIRKYKKINKVRQSKKREQNLCYLCFHKAFKDKVKLIVILLIIIL